MLKKNISMIIYNRVDFMKKLNYSIMRNDVKIYSSDSNYILKNNIITFYHEKIKLIINRQHESFTRETNDDILFISDIESYVFLKSENAKFKLDLDHFSFNINNETMVISYQILGDKETVKIVINL